MIKTLGYQLMMSDIYKSQKGEDAGIAIVNSKAREGLTEKLEEIRDQAVKFSW